MPNGEDEQSYLETAIKQVGKHQATIRRLRLVNAELLAACKAALERLENLEPRVCRNGVPSPGTIQTVRAAIALAEPEAK